MCFWIRLSLFPSLLGAWTRSSRRAHCEICSLLVGCVDAPSWTAAVVSSSPVDSSLSPSLSLSPARRLRPQLRPPSSILLSACPSRGERTDMGKGLLDNLSTEEQTQEPLVEPERCFLLFMRKMWFFLWNKQFLVFFSSMILTIMWRKVKNVLVFDT